MKAIKIAVIMILALNAGFSLMNWLSSEEPRPQLQQNMVVSQADETPAADGLDLSSLTALVKDVRSGQELERRLNEKGGVNNMDLNGDEQVDYMFVNEFGDVKDKIGYSLTVQPVKNEEQEVATVTVEKNGDRAEIQVIGNEQIYGENAIFNDWTQIEREKLPEQTGSNQAPMYHSYFYPRPLWVSPFFFGFYPPYYSFFPVMGRTTYVSHVNRYRSSGVQRGPNSYQQRSSRQIRSPNKGKTANRGIARSLRKPTSTQKRFQATRSRNLRSGGFGRGSAGRSQVADRKSGSFNRSSRVRSFSSRSSGFGTQRSGAFGRSSSRSSGFGYGSGAFGRSSFRSSSFGSRSFSFGK